jgi:hypothetical protein
MVARVSLTKLHPSYLLSTERRISAVLVALHNSAALI